MTSYFGTDKRFMRPEQRCYYKDGALIYGKEPLDKSMGPGVYFDKVNEYNRNWNTKRPKQQPMERGMKKEVPADVERINSILQRSGVVLPGAYYKKTQSPIGPGYYESDRYYKGYTPRPASSSATGTSRNRKSHDSGSGRPSPSGFTGTGTGSGTRSFQPPTRPTTAEPKGRWGDTLRHGIILEDNRFVDISHQYPGPGEHYQPDAGIGHYALSISHNVRRLEGYAESSIAVRPNSPSEFTHYRPKSAGAGAGYSHSGERVKERVITNSSTNALTAYLGQDGLSQGDASSVSMSASEQMALMMA